MPDAAVPPVEEISSPDFRDKLMRTARKSIRHIPFLEDVLAAYHCGTDPATPFKAKAAILGALSYFILPADMIPDFIVGFGFTDDLAVLTAAVAAVSGHIKPEHKDAARKTMATLTEETSGS